MTAALLLPLHKESTTALSFAAMLLSFASGDVANRALLASTEAVQLASQLLQVILVFEVAFECTHKFLCEYILGDNKCAKRYQAHPAVWLGLF